MDNDSGDESVEMLKTRYPHVKLIENKDNLGFSKACNQAIPESHGEFVLLLNPDTEVKDGAIGKLAQYLEEHPECGAVRPKVLNTDGTLQLACRRSFPSVKAAFFRVTYLSRLFPKSKTLSEYNLTFQDPDKTVEVDALSGSCMMVRRQAIDKIGLLDEDIFMFGEDIDWCWRIKQGGLDRFLPACGCHLSRAWGIQQTASGGRYNKPSQRHGSLLSEAPGAKSLANLQCLRVCCNLGAGFAVYTCKCRARACAKASALRHKNGTY